MKQATVTFLRPSRGIPISNQRMIPVFFFKCLICAQYADNRSEFIEILSSFL